MLDDQSPQSPPPIIVYLKNIFTVIQYTYLFRISKRKNTQNI